MVAMAVGAPVALAKTTKSAKRIINASHVSLSVIIKPVAMMAVGVPAAVARKTVIVTIRICVYVNHNAKIKPVAMTAVADYAAFAPRTLIVKKGNAWTKTQGKSWNRLKLKKARYPK